MLVCPLLKPFPLTFIELVAVPSFPHASCLAVLPGCFVVLLEDECGPPYAQTKSRVWVAAAQAGYQSPEVDLSASRFGLALSEAFSNLRSSSLALMISK